MREQYRRRNFALFSLTSGTDNTGLGFQALYHNTTG